MLVDLFMRYGYAMVFVASAVEGDATLLTATYLAHRGYLRLTLVVLAAALGTIAINQAYFWIARGYGRARLDVWRDRPAYGRVLGWISRYGVLLVLASRFIYGCRIAIPLACGATGMAAATFIVGDVLGAAIWSVVVGLAGYAIGEMLERLIENLRRYEWWIAVALLLAVLALLAHRGRDWPAVAALRARLVRRRNGTDGE